MEYSRWKKMGMAQNETRNKDEGACYNTPSPAKGEPHSTVGFLAADGKWKTQHGPEFTVSMRYECDPQKCP